MPWKTKYIVIYLLILSTACLYSTDIANTRTITLLVSSTATRNTSITPSFTNIPIIIKTNTTSYTRTNYPTYTPFTQTPIEAIKILYFTNGDCLYPCWWGINPGITTYQEVLLFVNQYKPEIKIMSSGDVFLELDWTDGNIITKRIRYPDFSDYTLDDPYTDILFDNDIVSLFHINTPNNEIDDKPTYSIPNNILRKYGIPDEIYVGQPGFSEIAGALDLIIIYREKHILFSMTIGGRGYENGFYHFCGDSINDLWLWETDRELKKETLSEFIGNFNSKPLIEVIPWDNQTFTEKLSPYNQICLYFSYDSLNNWFED